MTVNMKEIETELELKEACRENYRRQGITKGLLGYFEDLARKKGFKYITLGSKEDAFYEKCGYKVIFQVHDQNVFQKIL